MPVEKVSRGFKDISMSFEINPINNDIIGIKNETAIARSIRNLVLTTPGEKFFNPNLGTDIRSSLFDFCDFGTASVIQRQIITTIENFEPRIDNLDIEVIPRPDDNEFEVNIFFDIIGQQFPRQAFQFILEATR